MGIPLFTGQVGIPQNAPRAFPVENLDPRLYTEGLKASQLDPSTTTSIVRGLAQAGEYIDDSNLSQARTRALDESTRIAAEQAPYESELLQAQAANYRQDAALAPKQASADMLQAQAAEMRARAEAGKANQEARALKRQTDDAETIDSGFQAIRRAGEVNPDTGQPVGSEKDIDAGLRILERYPAALSNSALKSEGQGFGIDTGIMAEVAGLVPRIEGTDYFSVEQKEKDVERAKNVVRKFQRGVDLSRKIGNKKDQDPLDILNENITGAPKQTPDLFGETLGKSGVFNEEELLAQPRQTLPTEYEQPQTPQGRDVVFPTPGPLETFGKTEAEVEAEARSEESKPYTERFYDSGAQALFQDKVDKIQAELLKDEPNATLTQKLAAGRLAATIATKSTFGVTDTKRINDISAGYQNLNNLYEAQKGALNTLEGIMEEAAANDESFSPNLGESESVPRIIDKLRAKYGGNTVNGRKLDEVYKVLTASGTITAVQKILAMGGTSKLIDRKEETEIYAGIEAGEKNSLHQNIRSIESLGGMLQNIKDKLTIIETARRRGLSYQESDGLSNQFLLTNPATVPGTINGRTGPTQNRRRASPFDFLERAWDVKRHFKFRGKDGRVNSGTHTPVDVIEDTPKLAQEVEKLSFNWSSLNPLGATEAQAEEVSPDEQIGDQAEGILAGEVNLYPASDIPLKQPGGVDSATVMRMALIESGSKPGKFQPGATSPKGAKGIMQLMDETGKDLWKKFGFDGEYDPRDNQKNLMMGIKYMNELLPIFDNDIRLALAAYNMGPTALKKAYDKAEKHLGDTSWEAVKLYIPKENTETPAYVDKIVGTPEQLAKEKKRPTPEEVPDILASLPSTRAQANARENVSAEGYGELEKVSEVSDFETAKGTLLEPLTRLLLDLNPFRGPEEAGAEEPSSEAESPKAKSKTPKDEEGGLDFSGIDETLQGAGKMGMTPFTPSPQMISAIFGAARGVFWGYDDEIFAPFRMVLRGEDWDTALQNTRTIREHFQQQNPAYYLAGDIAGSISSGNALLKGAKAVKAGLGLGAATGMTIPQRVAEGERALTMFESAKRGAKVGAVTTGLRQTGETEGGVNDRLIGGAVGAGIGAVAGAVLDPLLTLGARALMSDAGRELAGTANSIYNQLKYKMTKAPLTGRPPYHATGYRPPRLTGTQKKMAETLPSSPRVLAEGEQALRNSTNPERSLVSTFRGSKASKFLEKSAKSQGEDSPLQTTSRRRVEEAVPRAEGMFTSAGYADNVTAEQAHGALGEGAKRIVKGFKDKLKTLGEDVYEKAEASLPNGFVSPEVQRASANSKTQEAIEEAYSDLDKNRTLAPNAFKILQYAKSLLRVGAGDEGISGAERHVYGEALDELRTAMRNESPVYATADDRYAKLYGEVEEKIAGGIGKIKKFISGNPTNVEELGKRLVSFDREQLKKVQTIYKEELGQDGVRLLQNSMFRTLTSDAAATAKSIETEGQQKVGKRIADKIKIVWEGKDGEQIVKNLKEESALIGGSKYLLKEGSQTYARMVDDIKNLAEQTKTHGTRAAIAGGSAGYFFSQGHNWLGISAGAAALGLAARATLPAQKAAALKAEELVAQQFSRTFVESPTEGLKLLNVVRDRLIYEKNNAGIQGWDRIVKRVKINFGKIAGSADVAASTQAAERNQVFKPQTRERENKKSQNFAEEQGRQREEIFKKARERGKKKFGSATDITIQGPGITQ